MFILGAWLAACGDTTPPPVRPEPVPASPPPAVARDEEPPAPEEEEAVEPLPDVDRMSRPELESACFQGRQAACDLLGH